MGQSNNFGPLKTRKWLWVVHGYYHLNGNPNTTEVKWVYTRDEEADKHRAWLTQKMGEQFGVNGATEKKIKMVAVSTRQYAKVLDKFLLGKFMRPGDTTSREIPAGHMPYDPPTRMSRRKHTELTDLQIAAKEVKKKSPVDERVNLNNLTRELKRKGPVDPRVALSTGNLNPRYQPSR